jgi:signal transduction histidine kinase
MSQGDLAFAAAVANELALLIENHRLNQENIRNERIAAIGMTITDLAHNIKNLVNINLNAVELMEILIEEMNKSKIVENWGFIRKGFEQINNLAVEMLDYAKDNKNDIKPVKINDLVLTTKDYIEYDLVHEGIELEVNLDPDNPEWMMDENQLQRALINLVVNSIDAIEKKESGKIQISAEAEDNRNLIIRVSDNGCGIDSDHINKIYSLFYTTKGAGGSGLGLPVVKKFVESMGGQLQVESNKGVGTTMSMVFPKITGHSEPSENATFVYSLK